MRLNCTRLASASKWSSPAIPARRGRVRWSLIPLFLLGLGTAPNRADAVTVTATTPPRYDLGVAPDLNQIWVFFSSMLAPLPPGAIRVAGTMSGLHTGQVVLADNVIIFTNQSEPFFPGEMVHVNLHQDIEAVGGSALPGGYYFAFTIESGPATLDWSNRNGYGASSIPYFIHGGDVDNDGHPDVVAPNEGTDDVSVFLNTSGTGVFPTHSDYGVGNKPSSIFGEDFDNDGDQDLATADIDGGTVTVLLNDGDGTYTHSQTLAAGVQCRQIHGGDFDGDNDIDLCSTSYGTDRVFIFSNNGNGTFPLGNPITAVSDGPFAIRTGDVDGDGHLDIGVACQNADSLTVLRNNGAGLFFRSGTYQIANGPWCLNGNDMDGDGDFDFCSVASFANRVAVLFNDGAGGFPTRHLAVSGSFPLGVFVADLDGDDDIDAMSSNYSAGTVGVYQNPGTGLIALQATLDVEISGSYTWAHDLDGDGDLDLSVVDEEADSLFVFYNDNEITAVEEEPEVEAVRDGRLGPAPGLRVLPNPLASAQGATLVLENLIGPTSVDLVAIDGRNLGRLWSGSLTGPQELNWDGRDARGQKLRPGRYLLVVESSGLRFSREVQVSP